MIIEPEVNNALMMFYVILGLVVAFGLMTMPYWPYWATDKAFIGALYIATPIIAFLLVRFSLWFIFYHIGISIWLLPNILCLKNVFSPLIEFDFYRDFFTPVALVTRLASIALTSFLSYSFYITILDNIANMKSKKKYTFI